MTTRVPNNSVRSAPPAAARATRVGESSTEGSGLLAGSQSERSVATVQAGASIWGVKDSQEDAKTFLSAIQSMQGHLPEGTLEGRVKQLTQDQRRLVQNTVLLAKQILNPKSREGKHLS